MPATSKAHGRTHVLKPLCILAAFSLQIIFVDTADTCSDDQVWSKCINNNCEYKTCDELGFPRKCTGGSTLECIEGCICRYPGYLKNSENECIPVDECPSCGGDFNATSGNGKHCGNLCSNYKQPYVFCMERPVKYECDCRKGYVFNDRIGKCVLPRDCPKPCRGDHYAEEKVCVDLKQPTCNKPHVVKSNKCQPPGTCGCISPYVLHKPGGKCVHFKTCPGNFSKEDFFPTEAPATTTVATTTTSTAATTITTSTGQVVTTSSLKGPELAALFKLGSRVVRGRDWSHGDEDGGRGSQGTVITVPYDGFVRVEWDNDNINTYSMGNGNKYELDLAENYVATEPEQTGSAKPKPIIPWSGNFSEKIFFPTEATTTSTTTTTASTTTATATTTTTAATTTTTTAAGQAVITLSIKSPEFAALFKLGSRVVRGRDWSHGDEDGGKGSQGTVIKEPSDGFMRVEWDNENMNTYSMGNGNKYELDLAENYVATESEQTGSAKPKPIIPRSGPELASLMTLNTKVVRGKDWAFDNEDGGPGSEGTVVRELNDDGTVRVEWDVSGNSNTYNMGKNGKYELDLANREEPAATS